MPAYDELVVNGVGGTLDNPCAGSTTFLVCAYSATAAWASAATRMLARVQRRVSDVAARSTIPAHLLRQIARLEADWRALPEPRFLRGPSQQAAESAAWAAWMSQGAAALRALDAVPGAPPPPEPETAPTGPRAPAVSTLAVVGFLGLAVLASIAGVVWVTR